MLWYQKELWLHRSTSFIYDWILCVLHLCAELLVTDSKELPPRVFRWHVTNVSRQPRIRTSFIDWRHTWDWLSLTYSWSTRNTLRRSSLPTSHSHSSSRYTLPYSLLTSMVTPDPLHTPYIYGYTWPSLLLLTSMVTPDPLLYYSLYLWSHQGQWVIFLCSRSFCCSISLLQSGCLLYHSYSL